MIYTKQKSEKGTYIFHKKINKSIYSYKCKPKLIDANAI